MPALTDLQFHRELITTINRLRDRHTQYAYAHWSGYVATLPFLVEEYSEADERHYTVTKVDRDRIPAEHRDTFKPGVELVSWSGIPFDRAVDLHADVELGGRPDSRRARALESLTLRSLQYSPPPDERWVMIDYRTQYQKLETVRFDWLVDKPGRVATARPANLGSGLRRAVNPAAEDVRRAKKLLFNRDKWDAEHAPYRAAAPADDYDDFLAAREVTFGATLRIGYLRIWSFDVASDDGFVDAACAMLKTLPQDGLIVDLRDNPGGLIPAAERLLQLFTAYPIATTRFAFRATPLTAAMAQTAFNRTAFGRWSPSLAAASFTGESYSSHLPVTRAELDANRANNYRHPGPVVVVVNANTYSAGDLFTAGVIDNNIGPVVCIGEATGGGARRSGHRCRFTTQSRSPAIDSRRCRRCSFTVAAMRAVCSGDAEGMLIEDNGIPGQPYAMTRNDVLPEKDAPANHDLIQHCASLIVSRR